MTRSSLFVFALLLAAVAPACSRSEEALQEDFDAYVDERDSCEADADCEPVFPGCPLGCAVAVNADAAGEVEAYAEGLIAEYESVGRSCAYTCPPFDGVCTDGECRAVEGEI